MVFSLFGAYCIIWLHYALFSVLSQPRLILLCLFKMLITRERLTRGARRAQKKEENQQSVKWALLLQIVNPLMGFPWMRKSNKRTERDGNTIERREKIIAATSSVSIKKWCARWQNSKELLPLVALARWLLLKGFADCPWIILVMHARQCIIKYTLSQQPKDVVVREYFSLLFSSRGAACAYNIFRSLARSIWAAGCVGVSALWKIESSARVLFACVRIFLASSCHAIVRCRGFYWANLHFCLRAPHTRLFCWSFVLGNFNLVGIYTTCGSLVSPCFENNWNASL